MCKPSINEGLAHRVAIVTVNLVTYTLSEIVNNNKISLSFKGTNLGNHVLI